MNHSAHPIPSIPGIQLHDPAIHDFLLTHLSNLCGLRSPKFPGSQPVSFSSASLEMLENLDFWVCEKSDGVRVLIFIVINGVTGNQEVWLVDRKQQFFLVDHLHFPHWAEPDSPIKDTVIDGELVIDINPTTGESILRFYAFDCLVLHGDSLMQKPLSKRYAPWSSPCHRLSGSTNCCSSPGYPLIEQRMKDWVVGPFEKALKTIPQWREELPFHIVAKKQELSYHLRQVLDVHIPMLEHGHDGLIFTCADSAYVPGTDPKILKWKPPSENSIDFKLELRFPPMSTRDSKPDLSAKPAFFLHTWLGGHNYEFFDYMEVEDEEWESMKASGEQWDDRIIEVCWDSERENWKFMRIRDDKNDANHKNIMEKIITSIQDGVEIDALLNRSDQIRKAWKAREANRSGRPPPGASQPPPIQTANLGPSQGPGGQRRPPPPYSATASTPGVSRGPAVVTPGAGGAAAGVLPGLKR